MTALASLYLDSCLAPLAPHLARSEVTDLYINQPGELWVETLGGVIEQHAAPELTTPLLHRLLRQVAAVTAQGINREHPILSAVLPSGERVQAVIPPATRGEIAIAVRKHAMAGLRLKDYTKSGAFAGSTVSAMGDQAERLGFVSESIDDIEAFLTDAVRQRRNILISGGTSSGKTTFLNALLHEIPASERLILIEDTPELQQTHANSVGLLASRSRLGEAAVTTEDLLIASLRMRPDRIILGEIRGSEAATFLRAVNTGHPGSITTIHADSPARAIDQLVLLVLQTGMRMHWEDVVTYVRRSIDIVVQLGRGEGGRKLTDILLA